MQSYSNCVYLHGYFNIFVYKQYYRPTESTHSSGAKQLYCYFLAPLITKQGYSNGAIAIFFASQLQCTSKDRCALQLKAKKKKKNYFLLCSHYVQNILIFFSLSSIPISTRCSSLPSVSPHTLHFFPLQASIPPLVIDPSPCLAPTTPIDLFVLYPYLSSISFFLYSVSQSFSVSNAKTHDRQCQVLILSL